MLKKDWLNPTILLVFVILGVLITRQYGESWDELKFYKYADSALEAYVTWPREGMIPLTGNTYDNYGPAYVMLVALGARLLNFVIPWSISDLRHLIYFITFLAGIWAFHELAKRWLSHNAALGATFLFMTQPLFWGHAFISPKDIPFLTFFLLSLFLGFRLVDSLEPVSLDSLTRHSKLTLLVLSTLWLATVIGLFAATPLIHAWIEGLVRAAARGETNIISQIASDIHKVEPEVYIQKYFVFFLLARATFFWLSIALLTWFYQRTLPAIFRFLGSITPAAIFLGVTTCIRVLGPLAGLFVTFYALRNKGKQAILPVALYIIIAGMAMYATWPYLWPNPIGHFIESIIVMAKYPWKGEVLFNSVMFASTDIPRSYLPILLGIQLTEPVWFLFAIGLAATIIGFARKRTESRQLLLLSIVWFILPLTIFIASRSPLYDNFRQIFFILPPVFMMAGVVFEKVKRTALQIALIILCLSPGIIDGLRLHPYEYIYYNRFIGGVQGAHRIFELDYWGISYREAATWLNENAPTHANIWVEGPAHLLQLYVRPNLKIYSTYEADRADNYDYVVATSRYNLDLTSYPDAKVIHSIERDEAVLTVIKQP